MKYKVKYYDVWCEEFHIYDCKADSEDDAIISFRRNVSSNVQRYKILMVKEVKEKMLVNEFQWRFAFTKQVLEKYIFLFKDTEHVKYLTEVRQLLLKAETSDQVEKIYDHLLFLGQIISNIDKEKE